MNYKLIPIIFGILLALSNFHITFANDETAFNDQVQTNDKVTNVENQDNANVVLNKDDDVKVDETGSNSDDESSNESDEDDVTYALNENKESNVSSADDDEEHVSNENEVVEVTNTSAEDSASSGVSHEDNANEVNTNEEHNEEVSSNDEVADVDNAHEEENTEVVNNESENDVVTADNDDEKSTNDDDALYAVTSGMTQFTHEFYKKLSAGRKVNLVTSPLSVGVTLGMAAQGARGFTEKQMNKVLHLSDNRATSRNGFKLLLDSLRVKQFDMHLASKMFVHEDSDITADFQDITETYFHSLTDNVDFYYPEDSSALINEWVEEATDGYLKNIVKPIDVKGTSLVLANAVHFKGIWQTEFRSEYTMPRPFSIDKKMYKIVPTMYQQNTVNYGTLPEVNAVYVELPYQHTDKSDEMSMFILLPNEVTGLKKVINYTEKFDFHSLHNNPTMKNVKLYLPKFKVRSTINLRPVLEKMGLVDAFQPSANFTGIVDDAPLKLDKFIQKAMIEVNEQGSQSAHSDAAATSNLVSENGPVEIHVDHPFLFAIYHSATNSVVFQGHVRTPALR